MRTEMTILGHNIIIKPSLATLSDIQKDDVVERIIYSITEEAGNFVSFGVEYEWEIVDEAEYLRNKLDEVSNRLEKLLDSDEIFVGSYVGDEIEEILSLIANKEKAEQTPEGDNNDSL